MVQPTVSLVHIVHKPTVPSPGKPPLLVLLHGVGSNEQDLFGLSAYVDPRFFVVSLRAPITIQHGAYAWYDIEWTATGVKHDGAGALRGLNAARQVIGEIVEFYGTDPKRVYLMGFSQGAILSLGLVISQPELIAGAVIMSGRLLPEFVDSAAEADRLNGFPILVVHGTRDSVLPVQNGREIQTFLQKTPADLRYREFEMAHSVSQESLSCITDWLTEQLDNRG